MIKLLIFDLDGTLADTSRDITDALNYALLPLGGPGYSIEETKLMVGSGMSKLLDSLVRELKGGDVPEAAELATRRFIDYYSRHLMDNTTAYPRVRETLLKLAGYKKAVLTNKREGYSKEILRSLGILEHFDLVRGSDSVREKKPSPVPVLDLMACFNVSGEETAITGDSDYDVAAGRAAGIKVIGVTYGFRPRNRLEGADFIIESFDQLLSVIPLL